MAESVSGKITLSMIVKNEVGRYLERALIKHRPWIDQAIIIDDGSTDGTPELCEELLQGVEHVLIRNKQSHFSDEVSLRKQQWEAAAQAGADWILNLDADEIFEDEWDEDLHALTTGPHEAVYFRLFDMWSETHYREDLYWRAHQIYRPFLVKFNSHQTYKWKETPQHCGRFPLNIFEFPYICHQARIQHFGWARREDRLHKYVRYRQLDPEAKYGWKEQYESILDTAPSLVPWKSH
ncbi:glycosyltransferase family 2 protein [Paenibacillus urinalis]|uniref:Glycosyltransferase family 2 protein n=1 Tax=Paenibacillus urinalis TaxID=521520 RepID=A0ABY7X7H4_9BACL|nr:glycosyltransferase [Paenibacillus urinalis]WDH98095.1 glycosyltransferase family 2 protein [Paenibacillus urinalis]WDI01777.1 glycosyltransferase family 2 protein [Paenibacillus urinalis]